MIIAAVLRADPSDGTTMTCTGEDGRVQEAPSPAPGIPFLDDWLREGGDAVFGGDCVPTEDAHHIPGMIKASADLIGSTPSPTVSDGSTAVGVAGFLQGHTWFYMFVLFVVSIAIRGAIIGFRQRWQDIEGFLQLLVSMTVIIGIGAAVVQLILQVTDGYAPWIINLAGNGDYMTNMTNLLADLPDPALGDIPGYLLVGVAWLAAGLQWLMLTAASVLLPVAIGLWPLFATIEGITSGHPWRAPITRFIGAFATYKFVIASIYAAAFKEIGDTTTGGNAGKGVLLLLLACLVMPMLIKTFAPYGAPPATGVSGAGVAAGGAAVIATR